MPADKRILNWDVSAGKPEPLIEAEAVITLFYYMQRVAPQVWQRPDAVRDCRRHHRARKP
jgi:hypothetical protein